MTITPVPTKRVSFLSSRKFEEVVSAVENAIGHPNLERLIEQMTAAVTYEELEAVVSPGLGPTGLMEFLRFDMGDVLGKGKPAPAPQSLRYLIGNPLTMRKMTELVLDAGAYAPITVLIDKRSDGVHLSYDSIASSLEPYGNEEASQVALELDANVEKILQDAASA